MLDTTAALVNCAGESTAAIYASASGGLGDYQFTLFADQEMTVAVTGPQPNGNFENLNSGTYWVQVVSVDCEARSEAVLISEPQPLVVLREEANPVSCSGDNDGSISVEVSGGTGEIRYAITPNLNQFDTVNTFTGLAPGAYQVIAQDQSGCFLLFDFEIAEPEPIQVIGTTTSEVCTGSGDGMIEIEISGGQAPYWTALDSNQSNAFVQDQLLFTDLSAGTHVIFVRDSRGCEATQILTIEAGVNINATVTPVYSCSGDVPDNYLEVVLEDPEMADAVMYALDTTDPASMQLTPDFANIAPGQHYLAISHVNGCLTTIPFEIADFQGLTLTLAEGNINQLVATAQGGSPQYRYWLNDVEMGNTNSFYISESGIYTVRVMDENGCVVEAQLFMQYIEIELPDHFSPTGEVLNELWMPKNVEAYPNILIKIYDRYGRVVADLSGAVEGWDGTYNGKPLPTGDYWYVVRLNGELDDREFFGHFTLYR
jgi:gliding motility-associated-like protein